MSNIQSNLNRSLTILAGFKKLGGIEDQITKQATANVDKNIADMDRHLETIEMMAGIDYRLQNMEKQIAIESAQSQVQSKVEISDRMKSLMEATDDGNAAAEVETSWNKYRQELIKEEKKKLRGK